MIAPNAQERLTQIVEPLLFWYQKNKRSLPWRDQPTPYRVWVSEIMLQQTRVEAVKPYFERFLSQLPSIEALASCPEDRLLKLWEGLGYYSRARNLQKAARLLVEQYGGQLPADYRQLTALPGIGDYTAGAIASIAFGIAVPAVDGNVLRVISRILCCGDDIGLPQTKQSFRQLLLPVVPQHSAGDFNQALMELGATVCLPSSARCLLCPLAALCRAHQKRPNKRGRFSSAPSLPSSVGRLRAPLPCCTADRTADCSPVFGKSLRSKEHSPRSRHSRQPRSCSSHLVFLFFRCSRKSLPATSSPTSNGR